MQERRFSQGETRSETANGKVYIVGRAASFDVMSSRLIDYYEIISRGAFDQVLADPATDVFHLIDHDSAKVLGRTSSGTTRIKSTAEGLVYRTEMPPVSYARDLVELLRRKDVNSSSFAFTVGADGQSWSVIDDPDTGEKVALRTITNFSGLFDVSTVSQPAYPNTQAQLASRTPIPAEIRSLLGKRAADDDNESDCTCDCSACLDSNCSDCSNEACIDDNCRAVVQAEYNRMSARCQNHGGTVQAAEDEGDRAARQRRLELALAE